MLTDNPPPMRPGSTNPLLRAGIQNVKRDTTTGQPIGQLSYVVFLLGRLLLSSHCLRNQWKSVHCTSKYMYPVQLELYCTLLCMWCELVCVSPPFESCLTTALLYSWQPQIHDPMAVPTPVWIQPTWIGSVSLVARHVRSLSCGEHNLVGPRPRTTIDVDHEASWAMLELDGEQEAVSFGMKWLCT
jgi:hypothetical protein